MTKFRNAVLKYRALPVATGLMTVCVAFPAFASEAGAPVSSTDWAPILQALTSQISVSGVVGVIAAAIGAAIGLVFMWWGVRKLVRMLMSAFKKGKLSI